MDAKEIKNELKKARESIRNKEFKDALKHCKAILDTDDNNYMALVLVAVSAEGLDQPDKALQSYKRAIAADDKQLLAWQGLSSFYEKNPSSVYRQHQTEVYLKLAELQAGNKEKEVEILTKLLDVVDNNTDTNVIDQVKERYEAMLKGETDVTIKTDLQKKFIFLLTKTQLGNTDTQLGSLCKEVLDTTSNTDNMEDIITTYLNVLVKTGDLSLRETCTALHHKFPTSLSAMEHVILCYLDSNIGLLDLVEDAEFCQQVELYTTMVTDHMTDHMTLNTAQGYLEACRRNYIQARALFNKVTEQSSRLVNVHYYQSVVCFQLHQYEAAIKYSEQGIKQIERKSRVLTRPSTDVTQAFQLVRVMALCNLGDKQSLNFAMETLKNDVDGDTDDIKLWNGRVHLKLGNIEEAKTHVSGMSECTQKLELDGHIAIQEHNYTHAVTCFERCMEDQPGHSDHYVNLVRCLWESIDTRPQCFTLLLKAAKIDPYNAVTFRYLGDFYCKEGHDKVRGEKCYQKSYDLDPYSDETGEALCDLLNDLGKEKKAHSMLVEVTNKASAGCSKWAWLRLGLYQVKHGEPSLAIASFQSALRADPSDNHVWECLGEGYLARGSYTASLKAFTKASTLDPTSIYSLYQMASIKQILGTYTEAIQEYKTILETSPNYVPVLKGLGETYILVAKHLLSKCFHGRARDRAQLAVDCLARAICVRPDLSCLWKLLGDACTMLHVLPQHGFRFEKPDQERSVICKMETLQFGERCYSRAIKLLPECSSLWHDLGVNYCHQSKCSTDAAAISLADKAELSLKKAIQQEAGNHRYWTSLGYVACLSYHYKPRLAQHCFIKSIEAENNNVIAWTNLAALYLSNDNVKLAHEAFKVAQSLEPSYVSCWIGQAMIAELVGHEDAMDLYRHTTELDNHIEGAIGYSHWVCSTLQNKDKQQSAIFQYAIQQMAAIPAASDALARFTDRVKTNVEAYNMYGLLLERQELYKTAVQQFKCAVDLLKGQDDIEGQMSKVMCNYARVLCKNHDFEEACKVYETAEVVESFEDVCQMALAYYRADKIQLSYEAYTRALEICLTDEDKSHVLTALAMVTYKFGDKENAKTTLFKSSQMSMPSPAGLKALCALGLLQSDVTLATAVVQELSSVGGRDVVFLTTIVNILQGNSAEVSRHIQRLLHSQPDDGRLWHLLSSILLRYSPHLGQAISTTARSSLALGGVHDKGVEQLIVTGDLSAGCHSDHGQSTHNALVSAQRAVHQYPECIESWVMLVASLHGEAIRSSHTDRRTALLEDQYTILDYILSKDDISLDVKLWCHKQKVVCSIHAGKQIDTLDSLDALMSQFGDDTDVQQYFEVFKHVLQDNKQALDTVVTDDAITYFWQILVEMYLKLGMIQDVQSILQHCLNMARRDTAAIGYKPTLLVHLIKLAHVSFQQILEASADTDHYKEVFDKTVDEILSLDPDCMCIMVMQATLNLTYNIRLSKHQFQKILDYHVTGSRGHDLSVARRALVYILYKGKKDTEMIEKVLAEAKECADLETQEYYNSILAAGVE